ncbi:hypothetical protein T4B_7601 [Trichinella pseudospiralis]|uniref:Uncharacterized protein n=2 Tax=Trichinella pseudospiralis TaxID=6337 RepID=A0A0V0XU90_TRIPS|nr:hypothetical protein T4E_2476 [Trichinella pseudospiralis]KRY68432.1 hypothetical protein T4A_12162 [Trichinella pseudospiralis]KRY86176.1 hypothetical protein T4D_14953 [Trichinella pseudospiralis]KRZ25835.1 hypothetical protein T4B_7601 [Trichinella pseudospiralis]
MIISHTALLSRLKRPRLNGHRSSSGLHRSRPSTKPLESDVAITAASIQLFVQSFNGSSAAQLLRTYNIDDAQFRPFEVQIDDESAIILNQNISTQSMHR